MKLRNLFLAIFASFATLLSCEKSEDLGIPRLESSTSELSFEKTSGSQTLEITATRDWKAVYDADWLVVEPKQGKGSSSAQKVTVTVLENSGLDREAVVKFDIGFSSKNLTVKQAGSGSASDAIVYFNNFDKTQAAKVGTQWPYLDAFDGWQNATGNGNSTVEYAYNSASARTNSANSASTYSDYSGSGMNYLWFGKDGYFEVKSITLPEGRSYMLSFGSERNEYDPNNPNIDNTFVPAEFPIYISNDGAKWVAVEYSFPGELKNRRWDLATAKFTLPAGIDKLYICVKPTKASAYTFDDLKLEIGSEAGTAVDFSKGVDLGLGGGTVTPPDPGTTVTGTLAELAAAADNSMLKTNEVLVVAKAQNALLLQEGTDYLLAYNTTSGAVGDKVIVTGLKSTYNNFAQLGTKDAAPTVEVKSSGNVVTHPTAKVLAAAFDSYTSTKIEFVSFKGKLSISGAYYNVSVEGASTNVGSLVAPLETIVPASANGKTVDVQGYYVYTSGGKYVNVIVVEATVSGDGPAPVDPALLVSNVTFAAEGSTKYYDATVKVNGSTAEVSGFKLGTSSAPGVAALTIPAGSTSLSFFAIGWGSEGGTTIVLNEGATEVEVNVASNSGATGSSPYTVIVDPAKDRYTVNFDALASETKFTVTTKAGAKPRVVVFGVQASK